MPEFFETRMGQQFYDGTMRRLAVAAESIAASLEQQLAARAAVPPGPVRLLDLAEFIEGAKLPDKVAALFGECVELLHGWVNAWPEDGDADDAAERAELTEQTRALLAKLKGGGK